MTSPNPALPSRILMTADTIGGVWTYAIDLIRELRSSGVEVALATFGRPLSREQSLVARALPNLEIFGSSYRLEWMDDPWRDIAEAGDWLLRLAAELEPDLIHFNHYAHASLPFNSPKLVVAHSDVLSWWKAVHHEPAPPEWSRYRELVTRGLQAADAVIAPSHATLAELQDSYGALENTKVIPNGRAQHFPSELEKEEFILTVGRLWDKAKNIAALDRIAPDLEWPIYAAGETDGELSSIRSLGYLPTEELAGQYARASIYALPAFYEPFGFSILEAAERGCALVLGDIPSLRENWSNSAVFVNPERHDELREALTFLIQNPEDRAELGRKARERARFYGAKKMASSYLEEYRVVAKPQLPLSQEQYIPLHRTS